MIIGNICGNTGGTPNSYEIVAEDGTTILAVATPDGNEEILDATVNDVRIGKHFASSEGILTGEKEIPSYHTTAGVCAIKPGASISMQLKTYDRYDYTKFQCIIVNYNTSISNSVESTMIVIDDGLYAVGSTEKLATITKDALTKSIDFNFTNNSTNRILIKYFTYKEEF